MSFFAGLDWGARGHAVCIIDERGNVQLSLDVRHDAAGLAELLARLRRVAPPEALPIAIERPSGLIVETLVAAGHPVVPIHPNVVKACRPRYRAAGGKSDPGDAYMLADILRTDGHRFRPLTPVSDELRALRALVRGRDDLVAARIGFANQLRSLLGSLSKASGPAPPLAIVLGPMADHGSPSRTSTARSPSPSWPARRRPTAHAASGSGAYRPSSPSTATPAGAAQRSSSRASAPRRRVSPARPRPTPRAR
jgi:hypothetical protein